MWTSLAAIVTDRTRQIAMARTVEVVVGVIGRPHGIRGELGIDVRTDEPATRFAVGTQLHAEGAPHRHWQVESTRWHGDRLLVRLAGVADRTAAEGLKGIRLALNVPATERPADEAEFYDHQLLGLEVLDHTRARVGQVIEVVHLPAHDLLRVELAAGNERLIPFATEVVPEVDIDSGCLVLADLPGLLDDAEIDPEAEIELEGGDRC